jgi:phytoene synthase
MLREGDRDRYLCALLTPDIHRGPIAALYAFNMEIARVRDVASEPMMGEVRLQWWKDLIGGQPHGNAAAHPIAAALQRAIADHALPRQSLINMIEARQFDLYDDPMPDRNTFEGFAGETASALIHLCAQVLNAERSAGSAAVAGHAGVAQLVAGLLLLLPTHRARGQLYIPADILKAADLDRERFLAGKETGQINQAVSAFAALGREHLRRARDDRGAIAPDCFAAFLPVAMAGPVFDRAEKHGALLLETALVLPQWRRQIRFWNAARKGLF